MMSSAVRKLVPRLGLNQYGSTKNRSRLLSSTVPMPKLDAALQVPTPLPSIAREAAERIMTPGEARDDTLNQPDYFGVRKLFSVKDLFDARVHLGHSVGTLDDRMRRFIFGKRFNQLIIDLDQTAEYLADALNVAAHIAYRGGIILFVCKQREVSFIVEKLAIESGEYCHTKYWSGGIFTNAYKLFGATIRLPDLCIVLNTRDTVLDEAVVVSEAAKSNIPTIGIVDTNCNPNLVTYPVPGNDDSPVSIALYARLFKEAILLGKKRRSEKLAEDSP